MAEVYLTLTRVVFELCTTYRIALYLNLTLTRVVFELATL